jgi:hypothetical protein
MPIVLLISIALIAGLVLLFNFLYNMFDRNGKGFKSFAALAFFVLPIFVGSILWASIAHVNRVEDCESFHTIVIDSQPQVEAECVRVVYDGEVKLVNMNDMFHGIIRKDTIVRRYCFEEWKYGINFMLVEQDYKYELITPDDNRYKKVNKLVEQEELKRMEKIWQADY